MINLKRNKGFTIVEIVVVMAIIAILVLIAVPQYTKYIERANDTKFTTEGAEIYSAITQGIEQLALAGENPYDEDQVVAIVNENMRTRGARSGNNTITISNGMDEAFDVDDNQTWGLVIDEDTQTITHNNQVDTDHNYVFVNGIYVEDFVAPDDGGGDIIPDPDPNPNPEPKPDPGSDNPTLDQQAVLITQAIYDAREIMKKNGQDTNNLFTITEMTNMIQNTQSLKDLLKPVFGNDNAGNRIKKGTDINPDEGYWGLDVVETGVYNDKNLDNDDIIVTNLTSKGLYTYKNGKFVSKT